MKCSTCGKMGCYEHGGKVKLDREGREDRLKGHVDKANEFYKKKYPNAKPIEHKGGIQSDYAEAGQSEPSSSYFAEGGEVGDDDNDLHDMVTGELMDALEKKDKKGVLDAIKALVMSCGSKA